MKPTIILGASLCLAGVLGAVTVPGCKSPAGAPAASETLDLATNTSEFFEKLRPANLRRVAESEFRRVPVSVGSNLFSFQFLDAARLSGAFKGSVKTLEPGVFLRTDTWRLGTTIAPGTLIETASGGALPVSIELTAGREITWSRPFDTKESALAALPRTPGELPLNSAQALRLESGEFVSLPVRMGLSLGVAEGGAAPNLTLQASAGIFWAGEFRLNVTRLEGSFVRLKIAPNDVKGTFLAFDANVDLSLFGFGPFGLVDLDREAERAAGLDVLKLAARRVHGETMMVDYVLDLSDRYGAMAYDALVSNTLAIKAKAIARAGVSGLGDFAFGDLTLAEALHAADRDRPAESRRVARVFRGARAFTEDAVSLRLGTKLLRANDQKSLSTNRMTTFDSRDRSAVWTYLVFNAQRRVSALVSAQRRTYSTAASAILDAEGDVMSLLFAWNSSERIASKNDKAAIAWASYAILGKTYGRLKINQGLADAPAAKLQVRLDVAFGRRFFEAMRELATSRPEQFEKRLWAAVYMISDRFKGRQGPRTPAPADSVAGEVRRMLESSVLSVRTFARNVVNTQWEGINGTTAKDLVEATLGLSKGDAPETMGRLLEVVYRDESAQEIAPALFLALADLMELEPWAAVKIDAGGSEVHQAEVGTNAEQAEQTYAADAFQRMNQLGYER